MTPTLKFSPIRIAVAGAGGRMGARTLALAAELPEFTPVGALEALNHPVIGRDAGLNAGCGELKFAVTATAEKACENAEVLIDFTAPSAIAGYASAVSKTAMGLVIGTTALSAEDQALIEKLSTKIPIVVAPNMSVGVNLLFQIAPLITRTLGPDYDIEIIEAHHNKKKDAPSGTALALLDQILDAREATRDCVVFGREGMTGERPQGEIGVHAVRAGDIVGEHTIIFSTGGERIELVHRASSRDTFAKGALRAAQWIAGREPGRYTMQDVLFGLNP